MSTGDGDRFSDVALARWFPGRKVWPTLEKPVRRLFSDPSHVGSWAELAMWLGDFHEPAQCLVVAQRARRLRCTAEEESRLSGHAAPAALDLGHGAWTEQRGIEWDPARMETWFEHELQPFGGSLEAAACFCVCLTAHRIEIVTGPPTPSLSDYSSFEPWRLLSAPG